MKKLFLFIFATMLAGQVWAYDFYAECASGQTLYYRITSDTAVAVTYVNYSATYGYNYNFVNNTYFKGDLVIPKTIAYDGIVYSVTSIDNYAFSRSSELTSVTIPNTVKSVGEQAFNACTGLKYILYPWQTIYRNVVWNINATISNDLFFEIIRDNAVKVYRYIGDSTSVEIPSTVVSEYGEEYSVVGICDNAFNGCTRLTSIVIPNSVTNIGDNAFNGCTGLSSIVIPNSVTKIGSGVFSGCSELTSVTIPNSITNIGDNAFNGCEKLDYNVYDNGCYVGNDDNPYLALFMTKKQDITSCTINNKCKVICGGAFSGRYNLTSITIPESVINIGYNAFCGCEKLEKAEFASANSFCGFCFENANANPLTYAHHLYINGEEVTDLVIPNTVTAIGNYAFYGCNNLKSVSIPNTITGIGDYAFNGCNSLKSLTIPNSVVSVGKSTFNGCDSLTAVTTESNADFSNSALYFKNDGVKYQVLDRESVEIAGIDRTIAPDGWSYKIEKTQMTIPTTITAGNTYNVVSIGKSAFERIRNLTSVIIPNSVTNIKEGAFISCSELKSITIPVSVSNIDTLAFAYCYVKTLEFNTNAIGRHFREKNSLKEVHIGDAVTNINTYSFANCDQLTIVTSAATTPPTLPDGDPFPKADTIYVKAGSVEAYQTAPYWKRKVILPYNTVAIKNVSDSTGTIDGSQFLLGEKGTTLTAVPAEGYHFVKWNDGDTINPRQFTTAVAEISASFEKHTIVVDSAVTATCTTSGLSEGSHCSVCGQVIKEQINYGMASHNYVTDAVVYPTCTESGLTRGSHCSVCGTVFVRQDTIPAWGHEFVNYVYNNDATTEADGTETAVCERGCGATDTRVKEGTKLATTAVAENAVNALNIYAHGRTIIVENATDEIRVYDAMGRIVGRDVARNVCTITINNSGVYIVKTGGAVKRVVVD